MKRRVKRKGKKEEKRLGGIGGVRMGRMLITVEAG